MYVCETKKVQEECTKHRKGTTSTPWGYIMGVAPFFVSPPPDFELVLIAGGPWGVRVDHIVLYIPRGILPRGSNRPY